MKKFIMSGNKVNVLESANICNENMKNISKIMSIVLWFYLTYGEIFVHEILHLYDFFIVLDNLQVRDIEHYLAQLEDGWLSEDG